MNAQTLVAHYITQCGPYVLNDGQPWRIFHSFYRIQLGMDRSMTHFGKTSTYAASRLHVVEYLLCSCFRRKWLPDFCALPKKRKIKLVPRTIIYFEAEFSIVACITSPHGCMSKRNLITCKEGRWESTKDRTSWNYLLTCIAQRMAYNNRLKSPDHQRTSITSCYQNTCKNTSEIFQYSAVSDSLHHIFNELFDS
jgi:hypothetical protein